MHLITDSLSFICTESRENWREACAFSTEQAWHKWLEHTLYCTLYSRFESHQCFYVYKYVDQKRGLAPMLAIKKSAGVTPVVNLRNTLDVRKGNMHTGFETQGRRHQKFKTRVNVAT